MKKFLLISCLALILLGFGGGLYFLNSIKPVSSDTTPQTFTINQGDGLSSISQRLAKNRLIRNPHAFIGLSYLLGLNKSLQAGSFFLSQSMSTQAIVSRLSKGGSFDYWLKIIDGSRVEEISAPKEFLAKAKDYEGYLFPDSYLIPAHYTEEDILKTIENNFNKKVLEAQRDPIQNGLDQKQHIILASLLEREAKTVQSKQVVAGILLNRLNINMPLQVDATVQYARDSMLPRPSKYWLPVKKSDLSIDSPFNTYQVNSLPPSPICNPGLDSIFASYHPIDSDYLYYITGNDGQMYYAKTLDEHNQNIAKYLR